MAKRVACRTLNSNPLGVKPTICAPTNIQFKRLHSNKKIYTKEIKIPVPWGHISAKVWGADATQRPILAVHGWQDNAGTWDTLAPLLVQNRPVMAIDIPGHGFSSWLPPGTQYHNWDVVRYILMLKEYFKWDKVSLLSHSLGSIAAQRFASTFPDLVDFLIAIDNLTFEDFDQNIVVEKYPKMIRKSLEFLSPLDKVPPCYSMEEIEQQWHLGTMKSVALESVQYLAKRGTLPSTVYPNRFYYSRDWRLKNILFALESKEFAEALIRRLKCPTLFIKAIDSPYGTNGFALEMLEFVEKNNPLFESHYVPGTHHVHLNNPGVVLPHILKFFRKYNITY